MADARSEQIIGECLTLLTGLTTTGANVQRGQVYPHEPDKIPAIAIYAGSDDLVQEHESSFIDWRMQLIIEAVVHIKSEYTLYNSLADQQLSTIRKEVHAALMADYTLGLGFVLDITPAGASEPELEKTGDGVTAIQQIVFEVMYRTSRTDISA